MTKLRAARLLGQADRVDPGLAAARISLSAPLRRKQHAIAAHYEAVGIRRALDELGYSLDSLRKMPDYTASLGAASTTLNPPPGEHTNLGDSK